MFNQFLSIKKSYTQKHIIADDIFLEQHFSYYKNYYLSDC